VKHADIVSRQLSDEFRCCEEATSENGCYFVFYAWNNAGGPCLFVADEPWVPSELRMRLDELSAMNDS
jgi:hypothetical protein